MAGQRTSYTGKKKISTLNISTVISILLKNVEETERPIHFIKHCTLIAFLGETLFNKSLISLVNFLVGFFFP